MINPIIDNQQRARGGQNNQAQNLQPVVKFCKECGARYECPRNNASRSTRCPCCQQIRQNKHHQEYKKARRACVNPATYYRVIDCPPAIDDDWPCGSLILPAVFRETLKLGYFPAGMVVERGGKQYRVTGEVLGVQHVEILQAVSA